MHYYLFKRFRYGFILTFIILLGSTVFAQVSVQGKVTDNNNQPMPGVSITVKENSTGTTTNSEGNYTISVPSKRSVLIFSYVGYPAQEIIVGDRTSVNIAMSQAAGQLNEVVVTGYGTQRRREVTSAITTVNAEQFNKGNVSDVAQLLQGKVFLLHGLEVTQMLVLLFACGDFLH
jgi:iron complex outermembrane receptor protein